VSASDLPKDDPRGDWFRAHPEAREFLETWMDMSAENDTRFTMSKFVKEVLREMYDFPWRDVQANGRWFSRTYGDRYKRAMMSRTRLS
jgi:hypothetical protein